MPTKPDIHDIVVAVFYRAGAGRYRRNETIAAIDRLKSYRGEYYIDPGYGPADWLAQLVVGGMLGSEVDYYTTGHLMSGLGGECKYDQLSGDWRQRVTDIAQKLRDTARPPDDRPTRTLWQLDQLRRHGFVHVTGVILTEKGKPRLPVIAVPESYGCWDRAPARDQSRFLIVTPDGEVWIMAGDLSNVPLELLKELCPNGRAPKTVWPTFWALPSDAIMRRLSDPYWQYETCQPSDEEVAAYRERQRDLVGINM